MVLLSDKHPIDLTIGQELPPTFHYAGVILPWLGRWTTDYLRVRVLDSQGHYTQQGAIVQRLEPADMSGLQTRVVSGANSYLSQGPYEVLFTGLEEDKEYGLRVLFIGGSLQVYDPITPLQASGYPGGTMTIQKP